MSNFHALREGLLSVFFFFFQAEDGIRDVAVTGVQTCALPISLLGFPPGPGLPLFFFELGAPLGLSELNAHQVAAVHMDDSGTDLPAHLARRRSEERRVGKECRSRWSPYH